MAENNKVTKKLMKRAEKTQNNLLVAFKASHAQAYHAAEKLDILIKNKPQIIPFLKEDVLSVLKSIKREQAAKTQGNQAILSGESEDDDGDFLSFSKERSDENIPQLLASSSISSKVSSEVVTLADILKKGKKKAMAVSSPMSAGKPASICKLEETPEERERRLARAARFEEEARALDQGPKAQVSMSLKRKNEVLSSKAQQRDKGGKKQKEVPTSHCSSNISKNSIVGGVSGGSSFDDDEEEWSKHAIVGTCMNLEKVYLRSTSAPKPSEVRPEFVLEQSLEHIKQKWKEAEDLDGDERKKMFAWVTEQFKSLRQDLRVQHIHSKLPIKAYETHGRVALECGDLNEYNQCAGRLRDLYTTALGREVGCVDEFNGYMILYAQIHHDNPSLIRSLSSSTMIESAAKSLPFNPSQSVQRLFSQPPISTFFQPPPSTSTSNSNKKKSKKKKIKDDILTAAAAVENFEDIPMVSVADAYNISSQWGPCTCHALDVVFALRHRNYHRFFILYDSAPRMSGYLMDFLVARVRQVAYDSALKAYAPHIDVMFLSQALGFARLKQTVENEETDDSEDDDDDDDAIEECVRFLRLNRAVMLEDGPSGQLSVDTKKSKQAQC